MLITIIFNKSVKNVSVYRVCFEIKYLGKCKNTNGKYESIGIKFLSHTTSNLQKGFDFFILYYKIKKM